LLRGLLEQRNDADRGMMVNVRVAA